MIKYILKFLLLLPMIFSCNNEKHFKIKSDIKKVKTYDLTNIENNIGIVGDFIIDKSDNIYVLDNSDFSINKIFNENDSCKTFILGEGRGPCELLNPKSISIDSRNQIYIADLNRKKIIIVDSSYQCSGSIDIDKLPSRILSLDNGQLLVYNFPFSTKDSLISYFRLNADKNEYIYKSSILEKIWDTRAIDFSGNTGRMIQDNSGNIFCSYFYPYEIRKYSNQLKLLKKYSREPKYFDSPYFEKSNTVNSLAGVRDIFIVNRKYLCAYIFYHKSNKLIKQIDVFDINTSKYLGYINLDKFGIDDIKYIRSNKKEYVYLCVENPLPKIIKFQIHLK